MTPIRALVTPQAELTARPAITTHIKVHSLSIGDLGWHQVRHEEPAAERNGESPGIIKTWSRVGLGGDYVILEPP